MSEVPHRSEKKQLNTAATIKAYLLFTLLRIRCILSQEDNMSTEGVNEILDKLIKQTQMNVSKSTSEMKGPVVKTSPGNDSNIYYFKTLMAPHIEYKSNSEIPHDTGHSNKTDLNISDESFDNLEDPLIPGKSEITRKSYMGADSQKHFGPKLGGLDNSYQGNTRRTGDVGENEYLFDDLMKTETVSDLSSSEQDIPIDLTHDALQNDHLKLLHDYPEIIIDHVTFDENERDNKNIEKTKSIQNAQNIQNVSKVENNKEKPLKIRFSIPEEDIDLEDPSSEDQDPRNFYTPDMKSVIDDFLQNQVLHNTLLKQTTESQSRKQSMLLEKVLRRLSDRKHITNNRHSYSIHQQRFIPTEMKTLQNPYVNVMPVLNKWEIHRRLLKLLLQICKPNVLKHTHLVAGLVDRIMSNIGYRSVFYDLYKK